MRVRKNIFLLMILLPVFSCRSKKENLKEKENTARISAVSEESRITPDSLSSGLLSGTLFPSNVVRLKEGGTGFIALDSGFFNRRYLSGSERETYYVQVRKVLPEKIIKIHQLAWDVLPVQEYQNFDGALFTIATYIPSTENPESEMIRVQLVRVFEHRLAPVPLLSEVRVFPATGEAQICDLNGECQEIVKK